MVWRSMFTNAFRSHRGAWRPVTADSGQDTFQCCEYSGVFDVGWGDEGVDWGDEGVVGVERLLGFDGLIL